MSNPTIDTILARSSYRGEYQNTPVPREDLIAIMEAGLAAPSGCNQQTTSIIAIDDPAVLADVKKIITRPNLQSVPALICVLTQEIASYRGNSYHVQDYSAAIENMLLAIKSLGYDSCWYEGYMNNEACLGRNYAITIANCFDIDIEAVIREKEELNRIKYNSPIHFEENR